MSFIEIREDLPDAKWPQVEGANRESFSLLPMETSTSHNVPARGGEVFVVNLADDCQVFSTHKTNRVLIASYRKLT